jgi:SAM-dependent methyltransferase
MTSLRGTTTWFGRHSDAFAKLPGLLPRRWSAKIVLVGPGAVVRAVGERLPIGVRAGFGGEQVAARFGLRLVEGLLRRLGAKSLVSYEAFELAHLAREHSAKHNRSHRVYVVDNKPDVLRAIRETKEISLPLRAVAKDEYASSFVSLNPRIGRGRVTTGVGHLRPYLRVMQADLRRFPMEEGRADVVVALKVLKYVPRALAVRALVETLKPHGVLVTDWLEPHERGEHRLEELRRFPSGAAIYRRRARPD